MRRAAVSGMTGRSPSADGRARRGLLRRAVAGVVVALAGLGLSGCWGENFAWNQKLKVVVETPSGERAGSAVTNVKTYVGLIPLSGNRRSSRSAGEATVVEVAPGKYLFVLLDDRTSNLAIDAWGSALPDTVEAFRAMERKRESITLPPDLYPMLVTFGNLNEPGSVQQVDPANLAASFGPGYALKSITLEITDEPVTQGAVEKVLPWAVSLRGSIGKDMGLPYRHLLNQVNDGSFIQGGTGGN